jgi:hypothetical protein
MSRFKVSMIVEAIRAPSAEDILCRTDSSRPDFTVASFSSGPFEALQERAKKAYEAYHRSVGRRQGEPLPIDWNKLPTEEQWAWGRAVEVGNA